MDKQKPSFFHYDHRQILGDRTNCQVAAAFKEWPCPGELEVERLTIVMANVPHESRDTIIRRRFRV